MERRDSVVVEIADRSPFESVNLSYNEALSQLSHIMWATDQEIVGYQTLADDQRKELRQLREAAAEANAGQFDIDSLDAPTMRRMIFLSTNAFGIERGISVNRLRNYSAQTYSRLAMCGLVDRHVEITSLSEDNYVVRKAVRRHQYEDTADYGTNTVAGVVVDGIKFGFEYENVFSGIVVRANRASRHAHDMSFRERYCHVKAVDRKTGEWLINLSVKGNPTIGIPAQVLAKDKSDQKVPEN